MNYARVTYMLFRTRVRHPAMLFGLLFTPCLFAVIEHFFPGESKFHAYLPIALASWSALLIPHNIICLREQGVLARLRLNTLTPRTIAVSLFIVDLILCVCCIAATIALASIVFSKNTFRGNCSVGWRYRPGNSSVFCPWICCINHLYQHQNHQYCWQFIDDWADAHIWNH